MCSGILGLYGWRGDMAWTQPYVAYHANYENNYRGD